MSDTDAVRTRIEPEPPRLKPPGPPAELRVPPRVEMPANGGRRHEVFPMIETWAETTRQP